MKKFILLIYSVLILASCGQQKPNIQQNSEKIHSEQAYEKTCSDRLYTPTYITYIDNKYFIVDCWHHRVIYSENLNSPIDEWKVLDDKLGGPHSITTDGDLLVVENTGYNMVKVYSKERDGNYKLVQELGEVGNRPHRVIYSEKMKGFYVLGSVSSDLYFFKNIAGELKLQFKKELEFLNGVYTRSFRIIDDRMFFVSGPNKIIEVNYQDSSFNVISEYNVPDELRGMNDIYKIGSYYYITATPQKFVRTRNLNNLKLGEYEDLYTKYGFKGTPYYFEKIGEYIYLPEITEYSSILRFKVNDDTIDNFERLHDSGLPTEDSINRKGEFLT